MKKYIIALLSIVFFFPVIAQNSDELDINSVQPEILTLGIGSGFNSFMGDYVKADNISPFTNIRPGYFLTLEKRFGKTFGIQLMASKSYLSDNERSVIINNNRNFESSILQIGTNFIFHFDNDFMIKRKSSFAPFIAAGFSYLKFDSYGDLMRGNDTTYYYWDNGEIWDVNQTDTSNTGSQVIRDYTYESMLNDSIVDYKRSTFSVPITLGFNFKLSNTIEARIFGTYNLTFTDWIDNVMENDNNDSYGFIGFSINYKFRKTNKAEKEKYKDVDFKGLSNADEDKDGITDINDNCSHTPSGVKVDKSGCPIDDDKDGIPNYIDLQKNTSLGANVDEFGREITDSIINNRIFLRDSIETERNKMFSDSASTGKIYEILNSDFEFNNLDPEIKTELTLLLNPADQNHDGRISKDEITIAINSFFDGNDNFNAQNLYDLIDYYFDQN
jgi:hypothetical protein